MVARHEGFDGDGKHLLNILVHYLWGNNSSLNLKETFESGNILTAAFTFVHSASALPPRSPNITFLLSAYESTFAPVE